MHLNIYDFDGVIATTKARKHLFDDWKNAPADKHEQSIKLLKDETITNFWEGLRSDKFDFGVPKDNCIVLTANAERFRKQVRWFLIKYEVFLADSIFMHPYPRVDIDPDVWKAQFIKRYVEMHSYIESVDFYDDAIANIDAVKRMIHETGYDFIKCHLVERE